MYPKEMAKAVDYYRNRNHAINNSNVLVRLVKTMYQDTTIPVLDYLSYIDNDAPYIARQFNMVTNGNKGRVLENVVFEGNSDEVFVVVDHTVDPFEFADTWRDFQSIRVIKTDSTDINYPIPFDYEKKLSGITIFEIDIKAMMLQYYYWSKERVSEERGTSANVFLPSVVLPNIAYSLTDYAIWNRLKMIHSGLDIPDSNIKHPLYLIDYTKGIDDVLKNIVKDNTNTSIYVTQLLKTVPAMFSESAMDVLYIYKDYYTMQSKWVLWVARLSEIVAIHKLIGKRGVRINKSLYSKIPYTVKLMDNGESTYNDKLGAYDRSVIRRDLAYVARYIGKR
jgi:hypothetical protein